MSTQITNRSALDQSNATSPGHRPMGVVPIALIALYLIVLSLLVLYGLVKLWPHPTPSGAPRVEALASPSLTPAPTITATPSPAIASGSPSPGAVAAVTTQPTPSSTPSPAANGKTPLPEPDTVSFFGGRLTAGIYAETRLLLLVILAGALGSLMHALRSLYWYIGNREMVWSWAAFYLLLPFTGALLAVIFYFVVRGGFFSPQASVETTSPFGFAALSALVGLFSPQATLKLKEVAETIFTKPGPGSDAKLQEVVQTIFTKAEPGSGTNPQEAASPPKSTGTTTSPPQVTTVTPNSGQASEMTKIVIQGDGFASGVQVRVGDSPAQVISSSTMSIEAMAPASGSGPGVVNIEVINPNGMKTVVPNSYTYV